MPAATISAVPVSALGSREELNVAAGFVARMAIRAEASNLVAIDSWSGSINESFLIFSDFKFGGLSEGSVWNFLFSADAKALFIVRSVTPTYFYALLRGDCGCDVGRRGWAGGCSEGWI